jgi:carbonic anhydrase/acetyltransferase-like protein (isoleucine patch superfamily)
LIGIGAILLSGCKIGKGSVIGAGALVKEGTIVEPNTLWVGIPAKKVKELFPEVIETNKKWAAKYVLLAKAHAQHNKSKKEIGRNNE